MVDWRRLLYCLSPYIPPPIIPIVLPRVVFVAKAWAGSPLITLLPALTTRTASLSNQLYCALSFICGRPTLSREPFTPLLLRILSISKQENCRNHVSSSFRKYFLLCTTAVMLHVYLDFVRSIEQKL